MIFRLDELNLIYQLLVDQLVYMRISKDYTQITLEEYQNLLIRLEKEIDILIREDIDNKMLKY